MGRETWHLLGLPPHSPGRQPQIYNAAGTSVLVERISLAGASGDGSADAPFVKTIPLPFGEYKVGSAAMLRCCSMCHALRRATAMEKQMACSRLQQDAAALAHFVRPSAPPCQVTIFGRNVTGDGEASDQSEATKVGESCCLVWRSRGLAWLQCCCAVQHAVCALHVSHLLMAGQLTRWLCPLPFPSATCPQS